MRNFSLTLAILGTTAITAPAFAQESLMIAEKPTELTILEVVNAVDPIRRIRTCPLGISTHGSRLCPLHRRVDDALASVEKAFGTTTLAEVLADPNPSIPLCEFPPTAHSTAVDA